MRRGLESVLAPIGVQHRICVDTHCEMSASTCILSDPDRLTVSKWIDRDQHMTNVCLHPNQHLFLVFVAQHAAPTYVYFRIFKSLLQIIVDSLIRYLAN